MKYSFLTILIFFCFVFPAHASIIGTSAESGLEISNFFGSATSTPSSHVDVSVASTDNLYIYRAFANLDWAQNAFAPGIKETQVESTHLSFNMGWDSPGPHDPSGASVTETNAGPEAVLSYATDTETTVSISLNLDYSSSYESFSPSEMVLMKSIDIAIGKANYSSPFIEFNDFITSIDPEGTGLILASTFTIFEDTDFYIDFDMTGSVPYNFDTWVKGDVNFDFLTPSTNTSIYATPEPSTIILFLCGLVSLLVTKKKFSFQ